MVGAAGLSRSLVLSLAAALLAALKRARDAITIRQAQAFPLPRLRSSGEPRTDLVRLYDLCSQGASALST